MNPVDMKLQKPLNEPTADCRRPFEHREWMERGGVVQFAIRTNVKNTTKCFPISVPSFCEREYEYAFVFPAAEVGKKAGNIGFDHAFHWGLADRTRH